MASASSALSAPATRIKAPLGAVSEAGTPFCPLCGSILPLPDCDPIKCVVCTFSTTYEELNLPVGYHVPSSLALELQVSSPLAHALAGHHNCIASPAHTSLGYP